MLITCRWQLHNMQTRSVMVLKAFAYVHRMDMGSGRGKCTSDDILGREQRLQTGGKAVANRLVRRLGLPKRAQETEVCHDSASERPPYPGRRQCASHLAISPISQLSATHLFAVLHLPNPPYCERVRACSDRRRGPANWRLKPRPRHIPRKQSPPLNRR